MNNKVTLESLKVLSFVTSDEKFESTIRGGFNSCDVADPKCQPCQSTCDVPILAGP
ncbi:MAG: pinensin family lanthipeptide [Acidobacteriota bacterium]|nr:pinensin family lanthipeptide [Acidobacteriota bacterium]